MQLVTEDETLVQDPDSEQLRTTLARLGLPGNGYAILAAGSHHYLQVAGSKADGYVAEYRDGAEETHHASVRSDLTHQQVLELMTAYLHDENWRSKIAWRAGVALPPAVQREERSAKRGSRLAIGLFLVIGLGFLAASGYSAYSTHRFLGRAVEVPGKVVHMIERKRRKRGTVYAPLVEYTDQQGKRWSLESKQASNPPSFQSGDIVSVLYDPTDPNFALDAKINSFGQLWGLSLLFFALGATFTTMTVLFWYGGTRRRRQAR